MSQAFLFDSAVLFAQYRLRGRLRSSVLVFVGTLVVLGLIGLEAAQSGANAREAFEVLGRLCVPLQVVMLLMVFPSRAIAAVRGDVTSKMIESHRIMPMSASEAIVGYVIGPNVTLLALVVLVMGTMAMLAFLADRPVVAGLWATAVIGSTSLLMTAILVFASFRYKINAIAPVLMLAPVWILKAAETDPLPVINVLALPFADESLFTLRRSAPNWFVLTAGGLQVLIALLYLIAACRVYRRSQRPGFTPLMGLGLLLLLCAACATGICASSTFGAPFRLGRHDFKTEVVISMSLCMFLSLLPVSAVARILTQQRTRTRHLADGRTVPAASGPLAVVFCAAVTLALWSGRSGSERLPAFFGVGFATAVVVLLSFGLCWYFLMRIAYRRLQSALILAVPLVLLSIIPVIIASIYSMHTGDDSANGWWGILAAFSPPAALWQCFTFPPKAFPGVAYQVMLAIGATILFYWTDRKSFAGRPPLTGQ